MKFSITIPAYKSTYLHQAICSVLAQTYEDFELIIVDDCSPENLKAIVSEFKDNRIRYYRNANNIGAINLVDNWNICLSYCEGDYVICMGDDDRLKPNCLEQYVGVINKYPELDVYHAWTEIIDSQGLHRETLEKRPEFETVISMIYKRMNGASQFIGDFCYKTKMLKQAGGYFNLPLAWCSDDITAYRAAYYKGIANTQEVCFEYRVSLRTISKNESEDIIQMKVFAILEQNKWLKRILQDINESALSLSDLNYYDYIQTNLKKYISEEIAYWAIKDIRFKNVKVIFWLQFFYKYHLKFTVLIKHYLGYIYHKYFH